MVWFGLQNGEELGILPSSPFPLLCTLDKFTDSAIAMNSKVNGEHKEKVLQRWEGGDSNSDDYDLESDMVS